MSEGNGSTESGADTDPALARVNGLAPQDFRAEFARCLDVDRWVAALEAGRPFADRAALLRAAEAHARTITAEEAAAALARHPRIGERAPGGGPEARWSRGEQSALDRGSDEDAARRVQRVLAFAQREYEDRFGQIYLVCASGRSARELVDDLLARLGNDPRTEAAVVAGELRKISLLRIGKMLDRT